MPTNLLGTNMPKLLLTETVFDLNCFAKNYLSPHIAKLTAL